MESLLVINYSMSRSHLVFAHQPEVVLALSEYFDSTTVITTEIDRERSSIQVISSPWRNDARVISALKFLVIFLRQIIRERPTVVFSHMTDVHAMIISPLCWILGIRHYLWYAHASKSPYLYFAYPFLTGVLTSTSGSCPLRGSKVTNIGQAVPEVFNLSISSYVSTAPPLRWYHMGRIDQSKNIETIVNAVQKVRGLGFDLSLDLFGKPSNSANIGYFEELKRKYSEDEYQDWVRFMGPVERKLVPEIISQYDGLIHAFYGSLDKVLVEAVMSRRFVLTTNREFWLEFNGSTSNLRFRIPSLENQLTQLMQARPESIKSEIDRKHAIAVSNHSFGRWIEKVSMILRKH